MKATTIRILTACLGMWAWQATADHAMPAKAESSRTAAQCDAQHAFRLGVEGQHYPDACPPESNAEFAYAYQSGRHLLELRNDLHETERTLAARNGDLLDLKSTTYELEAMLLTSPPTADRRLRILLELRELSEQSDEIEQEIAALETERDYQQHLLARIELTYSRT